MCRAAKKKVKGLEDFHFHTLRHTYTSKMRIRDRLEYGVMSMPALVVNEKVVAMGKVLKTADVVALLHKLGF